MSADLEIIVLAAGKGSRMYSDRPKVLHELAGQPLLAHTLECARALTPGAIHVVHGHGAEAVRERFADASVNWVLQEEQRGTGHAVKLALPFVRSDDARVLVLYGDVPLIRPETLAELVTAANSEAFALLTLELPNPGAYGRIVRDADGQVRRIVEKKDASTNELAIREINTGFLCTSARQLKRWVEQLGNDNAAHEYYLTDIVAMAVTDGVMIVTRAPRTAEEVQGVNSQEELAYLERAYQNNQALTLLRKGVTLRDPARLDVRGTLNCGRDVIIDVNVVFEGTVTLGDGVSVGPNNWLRNASVGAGAEILPNCVIEESAIGDHCRVGPFARLRPGTRLAAHAHVGNFVEIKNSEVAEGSKINHLSYVGDASVGRDVNIGAGTITCNYDGANKHRTVIGDRAFIGSNTSLVAPVTVGADATVGAGSAIAKDTPAGALTLTRAPQRTITAWKRPVKTGKKPKGKEKRK